MRHSVLKGCSTVQKIVTEIVFEIAIEILCLDGISERHIYLSQTIAALPYPTLSRIYAASH